MSDRDLRKLKRQDLLELLIMQSKDVIKLKTDNELKDQTVKELEESYARLRSTLDDKDAQIKQLTKRLTERLDRKEARIAQLEDQIAGDVVGQMQEQEDAGVVMNRIYEVVQGAVRDYMKQQKHPETEEAQHE